MRRLRVLVLLPALAACGTPDSGDVELTVAAAANLSRLLPHLVQVFEAETGIAVTTTIGASGQLAQQIENGAPVDVFLSADTGRVTQLEHSGRTVAGTRAPYASGLLVLFTINAEIERLEDLAGPAVERVAIANPDHAPYGQAARVALMRAGLWAAVEPKVILGENVRQALQFAETGNVDAALAAHALVIPERGRVIALPDSLDAPLVQELVVIAGRPHEAEARRFAAFVLGEEGRAIFERHGYSLPASADR